MQNIQLTDLLILYAPAAFAFVVGGGIWVFCSSTTPSLTAAAKKFKIYTWAIWPFASVVYAAFIWSIMMQSDRAELWSGASISPLTLFTGAATGVAVSLVTIFIMKAVYRSASSDNFSFYSTEYRELPGLILIAPITEEFIFRGYGALALNDSPAILAALITSLAFALIHFKPSLILISFFIGIGFFALFSATGNLMITIVAHAVANLLTWISMRREIAKLSAASAD